MSQTAAPPQQPAATTPAPQPARANRPPPPTRDPNTPGYVKATRLPDGAVPPADAYGNFIIGPTYKPAPEMTVQPGVPQGTVHNFDDELGGQQDLSGHRARARYIRHARSEQSGEAGRHDECARRRTRAAWRCTSRKQYMPGTVCRSSSALTGPIRCCSRRSTI